VRVGWVGVKPKGEQPGDRTGQVTSIYGKRRGDNKGKDGFSQTQTGQRGSKALCGERGENKLRE